MKALVTGATGFVGGVLAELLVSSGHTVTVLARVPAAAAALAARGARVVHGTLEEPAALLEAARGQEVVFHVAGLVRALDEADFLRANEAGSRSVAHAARQAGVARLIHVSSLAAAGPSGPGHPLRGGEPERPVTAYGRSKLAGERAVRETAPGWTILRPPLVYGPGDRELLRVFRLCRLGFAPVFGQGEQELNAVYARDLADALLAAASTERTVGGTYYACRDERFTTADLVREIGRAVGRPRVRIARLPEPLARPLLGLCAILARATGRATLLDHGKADELFQAAWTADPSSLARDTGWVAGHDLASGLRATATWYRGAGWL